MSEAKDENLLKTVQNIEKILSDMKEEKITRINVCQILIETMKFVEVFPDLSGNQKKSIVLQSIEIVMKKFSEDPSDDILLLLPGLIDSVINIDKGKINIHVTEKEVACCAAAIFGACSKKDKK